MTPLELKINYNARRRREKTPDRYKAFIEEKRGDYGAGDDDDAQQTEKTVRRKKERRASAEPVEREHRMWIGTGSHIADAAAHDLRGIGMFQHRKNGVTGNNDAYGHQQSDEPAPPAIFLHEADGHRHQPGPNRQRDEDKGVCKFLTIIGRQAVPKRQPE